MIRFHAEAEAEILEAQRFYAAIQPDLARSFRLEIELALARILEGPDRWPRGRLRTGKCKPGYWKARVKSGF